MKQIFILLLLASFTAAQKVLPSYIKTCSRHDPKLNECFAENANIAIKGFAEGDPEYSIPSLIPFEWKKQIQMNGPGMKFSFIDSILTGAENVTITDPSIDLDKNIIKFYITCPQMIWNGRYEAQVEENKIIKEKCGSVEFNITNGKFLMTFEYEIQSINGVEYAKLTSAKEAIESVNIDAKPNQSDTNNGLNKQEWTALSKLFYEESTLKQSAHETGEFISKIFDVVPFNIIFPE